MQMSKKRIFLILFVLCGICLMLLVAVRMALSDFSTQRWIEHVDTRQLMIEDLESEYHLIEKTEQEILELLGNPDKIEEYSVKGNNYKKYIYLLDEPSFEPRNYSVVLENGKAIKSGTNLY